MPNDKKIEGFEEFVTKLEDNSNQSNYWMSISEMAHVTGSSEQNVRTYIDSYKDFVRNSHHKYTTRHLYEEYTPYISKVYHTWLGKIQ